MTYKNRNLKFILLFFLLLTYVPTINANEPCLKIQDAWIAEAPPVSKVMVAYLTISNESSQQVEITNAKSELYSSIEFHETVHEDGLARMIRHKSLIIPAKSSLKLQPGEKHLMLFNPKKVLKMNDSVTVIFTFSDNSSQSINIDVKKTKFK